MDDPRYRATLYGDISSVAQLNRAGPALIALLERGEWHPRLLNGSDYPLPGIVPIYSMSRLTELGVIEHRLAPVLAAVREHNPLLFDFVLKRHLRAGNKRFAKGVFETRRFFDRQESAASARLPRAG
jgi:mannonate dehydratase